MSISLLLAVTIVLEALAILLLLNRRSWFSLGRNRTQQRHGTVNKSKASVVTDQDIGYEMKPAGDTLSVPKAGEQEVVEGQAKSAAGALFSTHVLWYEGSPNHGYQDSSCCDTNLGFAAVADGVTISCRPELLAQSLTSYFVQEQFHLDKPTEQDLWWRLCRRKWFLTVTPEFASMNPSEQLNYQQRGGHSTFLGFRFEAPDSYWLYGIGDCCAFWFRGSSLVAVEPNISAFDNSPATLATKDEAPGDKMGVLSSGKLRGDLLVLASDKIAEFLIENEPWKKNSSFWKKMQGHELSSFADWAEEQKRGGLLHPDDYTLLMLHFPEEVLQHLSGCVTVAESDIATDLTLPQGGTGESGHSKNTS